MPMRAFWRAMLVFARQSSIFLNFNPSFFHIVDWFGAGHKLLSCFKNLMFLNWFLLIDKFFKLHLSKRFVFRDSTFNKLPDRLFVFVLSQHPYFVEVCLVNQILLFFLQFLPEFPLFKILSLTSAYVFFTFLDISKNFHLILQFIVLFYLALKSCFYLFLERSCV